MKKTLLLLLTLLPGLLMADKIYKWTDTNGTVHFSHKPPQHSQSADVLDLPEFPSIHGSSDARAVAEIVEKRSDTETSQVSEQASLKAYCASLMSNMETLKNSPRVRVKKDNGEYDILDDEGRKSEMARIERLLQENCL